jgi:uncharacterized protein YciI
MGHYLLSYELADDYLERPPDFREAHLAQAWSEADAGTLVLAGAIGDPVESALLVFTDADSASRFATSDPYVVNGLVRSWRVMAWNTVVGNACANPVRPKGSLD